MHKTCQEADELKLTFLAIGISPSALLLLLMLPFITRMSICTMYFTVIHVGQFTLSPNSILRRHFLYLFHYYQPKPMWVDFSTAENLLQEEGGIFTPRMVRFGRWESIVICFFIIELALFQQQTVFLYSGTHAPLF